MKWQTCEIANALLWAATIVAVGFVLRSAESIWLVLGILVLAAFASVFVVWRQACRARLR